ncbi:Leucine-rich repeat protein kinase family protein [Prunus dulcis]|uniref:Leucine-rich repeat protein kinase family protein n=1 Tax=Prunus dulcis TaxID=3755 RepID=A0A5H2XSY7_PRUDU|nr:Leucine-rich repeat protein kinase family protein [Prunus dulcis]
MMNLLKNSQLSI